MSQLDASSWLICRSQESCYGHISGAGAAEIQRALAAAATLGREECAAIVAQHGWPCPRVLADRVVFVVGGKMSNAEQDEEGAGNVD